MEDTRNLRDEYKGMANEEVFDELAKKRAALEVAIENVSHDFNAGTIVRNANNFNVAKVHIIGRRKYNRRGAMCTDKYLEIVHWEDIADFVKDQRVRGREMVAIENNVANRKITARAAKNSGTDNVFAETNNASAGITNASVEITNASVEKTNASAGKNENFLREQPLEEKKFKPGTTLIFGGESDGLSDEILLFCDDIREITSYGSTRSVNVGVASGIAMFEWAKQQKLPL